MTQRASHSAVPQVDGQIRTVGALILFSGCGGRSIAVSGLDMLPLDAAKRGKRTLLETLQCLVEQHPDKIVASIPRSDSDLSEGFQDVTYRELGRAVDGLAHAVDKQHGRTRTYETFMFMGGASDLRYAVCFYAFQQCGYKTLLLSPGNPLEHNVTLLRESRCVKCLYTPEHHAIIADLRPHIPGMQSDEMKPWDFYARHDLGPFSGTVRSYEQSKWDPILVLHSSGSTKAPSPVILRNGYFTANDAVFPPLQGRQMAGMESFRRLSGDRHIYSPIPAFHLSGFSNICVYPIFGECINVQTPIAVKRADATLIKDILEAKAVKLMNTVPADYEGIVKLKGGTETLSSLDYLGYVGGPLSRDLGESLKNRVRLIQFYGSTECGGTGLLVPEPDDWEYLEYHPDFAPKFEPVVDKISEFIWTNPRSTSDCVMCKWTLPATIQGLPTAEQIRDAEERQEFRTNDLFVPHLDPQRQHLWRFYGRKDDIIVAANGDKLNPVPAELAIMRHPEITGALIVGQGKTASGLLIEPKDPTQNPGAFLNEIWPVVQQANESLENWGSMTIQQSRIALVDPGSFVRPPKATIARRPTTEKFQQLVDQLCS